ncbi:MAG: hypothetical protein QM729_07310 [Solirubrobacterales bacterium]
MIALAITAIDTSSGADSGNGTSPTRSDRVMSRCSSPVKEGYVLAPLRNAREFPAQQVRRLGISVYRFNEARHEIRSLSA